MDCPFAAVAVPTALALAVAAGLGRTAQAQEATAIADAEAACPAFLGFGAEWDSADYPHYGITDADFEVFAARIRWMRTPIVRVMMLAKWCYRADGSFDWDNEQMRVLFRNLDLCQELGTTVLLTDWGCERNWVSIPGVENTADPAYARVIGAYLDYLVNERGYSCIKYLILVNEPNYEVGDFARWKAGIENVAAELERRGLDGQITLAGSDESNAPNWHQRAVDELHHVFGAYDVHCYANDSMVRPGGLESFYKEHWDYALAHDPAAATKPFLVGEAGMNDGAKHPAINTNIDSFYYGLFMADYAVQAVRAGSAAVCAWMMDDNGHRGFTWGLWDNKANGLRLRSWFYPWALLSRYVPRGATTYRIPSPSPDCRGFAAAVPSSSPTGAGWTICLVNRGDAPAQAALQVPGGGPAHVKHYLYAPDNAPAGPEGFPVPHAGGEIEPGQPIALSCPAGAVLLVTNLPG
ncbi:MAG: hypothetical protein JXR94_24560 [Candidatus Hydrogenedentes bacterium]|nr:hypothetical protein [Candidatus Hydrogenedentota bacterium]